jgi:hypothetical protein
MTRPITAPEQSLLRQVQQFSKLGLYIVSPPVVLQAQVLAAPASNDNVGSIQFYNVIAGSAGAIMAYNQTGWLGSTPGAYDLGTFRLISISFMGGSSGAVGTLKIGLTSEVQWQTNAYITIVNEYGLFPKTSILDINTGNMLIDNDQAYTDQHYYLNPIPIMGPDALLYLQGGSVSLALDASPSWVPVGGSGDTVSTWLWACSGSGATFTSGSVANPTITFTLPGVYDVSCTVGTTASRYTTGHRVVAVYNDANPLLTMLTLDECRGDVDSGGWSFQVTMYAQAALPAIVDRAKVFLGTQDYYGGSPANLGPYPGYENLIAVGWIDGQTIEYNPEQSTVQFTVDGPAYWLNMIMSWPAGIIDVTTNPTNWNQYKNFNVDAFYWHVIRWRSTASEIMDCYPSGDTVRMVGSTAPWGTVWGQITQVGQSRRLIQPYSDRYGKVYFMPPTKFVLSFLRTSIPVVMEVAKLDWRDTVEIQRQTVQQVSYQDTTAMTWDGTTPNGYRAGAWGTAAGRFGAMQNTTELYVSANTSGSYGALFGQQSGTNKLAGLLLASANNPLPSVTVPLAANNRFIDIAPNQFFSLSIAAADNPRGFTMQSQYMVPNQVNYTWDSKSGVLLADVTAEGNTIPIDGYWLPFYSGDDTPLPPSTPTPPVNSIGPGNTPPWFPGAPCSLGLKTTQAVTIPINKTIQTIGGGAVSVYLPWHGKIRPSSAVYPTIINLYESTYTTTSASPGVADWVPTGNMYGVTVQGCNISGSPIITAVAAGSAAYYDGTVSGVRPFIFTSGSMVEVYGFLITAISGGTSYTYAPSGSPIVASGSPLYYYAGSNQNQWTGNYNNSGSTGGVNMAPYCGPIGGSVAEYYIETTGGPNDQYYFGDGQHTYHTQSWGVYASVDWPLPHIGNGVYGSFGRLINYSDGAVVYDSGFSLSLYGAAYWTAFFDHVDTTDGYNLRGYFNSQNSAFSVASIYPPLNWGYAWASVSYGQSWKIGIASKVLSGTLSTRVQLAQMSILNWCRYTDL